MKTTIKTLAYGMVLSASALLLSGCNDWLTKEPLSSITPEQYFNTEAAVLSFVDGRYTDFLPGHGGWSSTTGWDYGRFAADATSDNQISAAGPGDKFLGLWLVPQTGGEYDFSNIYKCNWFFSQVLDRYNAGEISGVKENIDHYIGEMYFLRAYGYFDKLQAFGDYPIVTVPLQDSKESLIAASHRMPSDSVARFIMQDLDRAASLMTAKMSNSRISRDAALLLKSRVALWEGSFLKNFAGTPFVPGNAEWVGMQKDYNKGYTFPHGDINAEAEWFFRQAMAAAEQVADAAVLTENTGTVQQSETDPVNPYMDMFGTEDLYDNPEVILWCPYAANLVSHSVVYFAHRGNGGTGLTRGLVDSYLMKDGLPIYASPLYQGDESFAAVRADRDMRLSCFLKEPGQRNYVYPTTEANSAIEIEPLPQFTGVVETYATGYSLRKGNSTYQKQCKQAGSTTGCITFRSAEALLNYIEACYEANGSLDSKAEGYWRALRRRAGVDEDFTKTIAATDMTQEAKNDFGAYTAGQVVDATRYNIRRERRSEFLAEGMRWMDLIRWRALDQLTTTPYQPEGIHIWSAGMKQIYADAGVELKADGTVNANVSPQSDGEYYKPYRRNAKQEGYDGLTWHMAYYLSPINVKEFLLTSTDGATKETSPLYQNPYWSTDADSPAEK